MFHTHKPTTIIPTNGSFILDEMYDMRVTQIGGTEGYSAGGSQAVIDSLNTYLYIKCSDANEQVKYAKITISVHDKVIIDDGLSSSTVDKDNNLIYKSINNFLRLCPATTPYVCPLQHDSEFSNIESISLSYVFENNALVLMPTFEQIKEYFKWAELVDKPLPHAMYFSERI